jgi:hypothetical protein
MADSTALVGLRRLVQHSHTMLQLHTASAPLDGYPTGADRAQAWAANQMAIQVLKLVQDCLPQEATSGELESPADGGFWLAYYPDLSALIPFTSEVDCLRVATAQNMNILNCRFGADIREQARL